MCFFETEFKIEKIMNFLISHRTDPIFLTGSGDWTPYRHEAKRFDSPDLAWKFFTSTNHNENEGRILYSYHNGPISEFARPDPHDWSPLNDF